MFKPTGQNGVFQDIISQFEKAILNGDLKVGSKLPSEREMQATFKTSRSTLREALRVLEQRGLITIKKGSAGGAFVEETSVDKIGKDLLFLMRRGGVTYTQLIEYSSTVEVKVFELAATYASEGDIATLKDHLTQLETIYNEKPVSLECFFRVERKLHGAVLDMVDNPVYKLALDVIYSNTISDTWKLVEFHPIRNSIIDMTFNDWCEIVSAFENKDVFLVSSTIQAHIFSYYRMMKKHLKDNNICESILFDGRVGGR